MRHQTAQVLSITFQLVALYQGAVCQEQAGSSQAHLTKSAAAPRPQSSDSSAQRQVSLLASCPPSPDRACVHEELNRKVLVRFVCLPSGQLMWLEGFWSS